MLSVSESKVWQLVREGELDTVKIGWSRRIVAASVDDYTLEFAASLADEWGLHGDGWTTPSAMDLLRPPGAPVTMAEALYQEMGVEQPQVEQRPQYPGIKELRARLQI